MNDQVEPELPKLVTPEDIGRIATEWAREQADAQRARMTITFDGTRWSIRTMQESWGPRELAAAPPATAIAPAEPPALVPEVVHD